MSLAGVSSGLRIAYMTGQYPRATDTFIQREVAALRGRGVFVQTFSIRKPEKSENVSPEQEAEGARTHYVLPATFAALMRRMPGCCSESRGDTWRRSRPH